MYFTNTLQTQNNSLTGTGDFRTNEKTVNDIYLQTVAVGNTTFSTNQLTALQSIAAQCPLSGGEAVLRARDMLALTQNVPIFYYDATNCSANGLRPSQDRIETNLLGDFVEVQPNPASESVTVKYELSDEVNHHIVFMTVYGQVMSDILLNGKAGEITISIGNLPTGIYWYAVSGSNASVTSGKLIINH